MLCAVPFYRFLFLVTRRIVWSSHRYHAFHVLYNTYRFICHSAETFTALDVLGMFTSAICHDMDHCGLNNAYLCDNEDPLACHYQHKSTLGKSCSFLSVSFSLPSVLLSSMTFFFFNPNFIFFFLPSTIWCCRSISITENHSIALARELLAHPSTNFLCNLSKEDFNTIDSIINDFILATDISDKTTVARVKTEWAEAAANYDQQNDTCRRVLLRSTLLCADIGVVIEPFEIFVRHLLSLSLLALVPFLVFCFLSFSPLCSPSFFGSTSSFFSSSLCLIGCLFAHALLFFSYILLYDLFSICSSPAGFVGEAFICGAGPHELASRLQPNLPRQSNQILVPLRKTAFHGHSRDGTLEEVGYVDGRPRCQSRAVEGV